jgi:hypothetical protein
MRLLPKSLGRALLVTSIATVLVPKPALAAEPTDAVQPAAYTTLTVRPNKTVEYDLAKLQARGQIVYVSSGANAFAVRMIDNDRRTVFRFPGHDLHPTIIVELAEHEPIHRIGAVFDSEQNAKLDVYLINELPKNLGNLDGAQPLSCSIDQAHPNEAGIGFAPTNVRYVVYRWTREKKTKSPFQVAEVSALSSVAPEEIPPIFAESEIHFASETKIDLSNKLGTLADPPSVAVVSP